jgi:serine/threonine protein phosphatase PrpC
MYAGSTALGAFVKGNNLTVFNIGDCQAVLSTKGNPVGDILFKFVLLSCKSA